MLQSMADELTALTGTEERLSLEQYYRLTTIRDELQTMCELREP